MRVNTTFLCALSIVCVARHAYAQPDDAAGEPAAEPTAKSEPPAVALPPPAPPEKETITVAGVIEAPELDAPLAGAAVTVAGTKLITLTDDEGRYALEVPPGQARIRVDFPGFKSAEKTLNLSKGDKVELGFSLETATLNETIVVVGSRTPRTNVDSPSPVDVVTSEEIARSGRTETGRVLHSLAASYISAPQTVADGSDHVDPASLRGLGPDQVLILVNGKRRHRSALMHVNGTFGRGTVGTDLNAIAVGSIKRIEILRDGAASQYGSDAIAGVINIVTKDVTDLLDVTAETGITGSRDGEQLKASANYGFKLGDKGGFLNLTGEFLQRGATNRSGRYEGTIYDADPNIDAGLLAESGKSRDFFGMRIGEASATTGIAAYNMELPVGDVAKFYSFGDLGHRRGSAGGFYRFPKEQEKNVADFYPNGFLPLIEPQIDDAAFTIGIRRKGDWNVDASLTHGRNSFQFNIENTVNASLGTASPQTFDAGTLAFEQTVADLDLLHKIDQKTFHALSVVLGSELRVERYRIEAGDEASYVAGPDTYTDAMGNPQPKVPGAQVFPGFQPSNEVDRRRDNIGLYAGLESELTKKIALDIGGRFENYSDFGRSLIGKIAGRAKLGGPVGIRGGISTGFRAPSLHQLWFSNVSTQFVPTMTGLSSVQVFTPNNASPITRRGFRIPELREERSLNISGGLTLKSGGNFSLTADGYFIRLEDRIVLTSQFSDGNPIVAEILAPFPGVNRAQFFANAVDTDTKGLDIVGDYSVDAGDGKLTLTGSVNFTTTEVTAINIPSSLASKFSENPGELESFYFGRLARNRLEDSVPHQKGTFAIRYTLGGLTALARANYYGKVFYKPDTPADDEVFGAKVLFDLDFGYQFTKNVLVTVGADNLFNTFPDKQTKAVNISSGRFLYSRNVTQFGQNGGFYYAKLELTFF